MHTYDRGNLTFLCVCRYTNNPKLSTPVPNTQCAATTRFRGALLRVKNRPYSHRKHPHQRRPRSLHIVVMHRSFPSTCPILSKHSYLSTHYNTHIGSDSVDRTNAALVFWNVSHERRTASICVAQTRQSYSGGNVHQSHSYKTTDVGGRRNGDNDSILFARTVGCQ